MCRNSFLDVFVSFKCCYLFVFANFLGLSFIGFQFFLNLVILGRNRLYVITRAILFNIFWMLFSVIWPIQYKYIYIYIHIYIYIYIYITYIYYIYIYIFNRTKIGGLELEKRQVFPKRFGGGLF